MTSPLNIAINIPWFYCLSVCVPCARTEGGLCINVQLHVCRLPKVCWMCFWLWNMTPQWMVVYVIVRLIGVSLVIAEREHQASLDTGRLRVIWFLFCSLCVLNVLCYISFLSNWLMGFIVKAEGCQKLNLNNKEKHKWSNGVETFMDDIPWNFKLMHFVLIFQFHHRGVVWNRCGFTHWFADSHMLLLLLLLLLLLQE